MITLIGYLALIAAWFTIAAAVGFAIGIQWHAMTFERHAAQAMRLANPRK